MMLAHHKGRATRAQGPARPPEGSLLAATGGRHRRLTMSRQRRRDASYPEAAKSDHMSHPPMKVSTKSPERLPNGPKGGNSIRLDSKLGDKLLVRAARLRNDHAFPVAGRLSRAVTGPPGWLVGRAGVWRAP